MRPFYLLLSVLSSSCTLEIPLKSDDLGGELAYPEIIGNGRNAGNMMIPTTLIELAGAQSDASTLFAEAIDKDSNLEMDWLWLAQQVTNNGEREYAFRRALYINPGSEAARRGLRKLETRSTIAHTPYDGFLRQFRNGLRLITSNR